ncbi:MAG: dephospho-CoA kinase [Pseudomonadota bacterium]
MTLGVGLTGGIGSGKSTVADLFAQHGIKIVDTDVIAHQLTQANAAGIPPIRAAFGDTYIHADGSLNRGKMRDRIYTDPLAKQRLEQILHPLILQQCRSRLRQLLTEPYVIIVIPLLPEVPDFKELVQRTLVVDCSEQTQIKRVMQRSDLTEEQARAIIAQQTPRAIRQTLADDLILNETGLEHLAKEVAALHRRYQGNSN